MSTNQKDRRILINAMDWWQDDRTRLRTTRILIRLLFFASIAGTVYSGVKGALPIWAISLYVFVAIELVYMTFLYAIRHSGRLEITRAIYDLRVQRVKQWELERGILGEFLRLTACHCAGIDPVPHRQARRQRIASQPLPFPQFNVSDEISRMVRRSFGRFLPQAVRYLEGDDNRQLATGDAPLTTAAVENVQRPSDLMTLEVFIGPRTVQLDLIAFSAETMIEIGKRFTDELTLLLGACDSETLQDVEVLVRILVRDTEPDETWLVPVTKIEANDAVYIEGLRDRFRMLQRTFVSKFEDTLRTLIEPSGHVDLKVRGYRLEPLFKGLLIDGIEGLMGMYAITSLHDPPGWDYSGHIVDLFRIDHDGTLFEKTAYEMFRQWFNYAWSEEVSHTIIR
jgi:hypothetical protein